MFMLPLLCALSVFLFLSVLHQINFSDCLRALLSQHGTLDSQQQSYSKFARTRTPKTYYCSL